MKNVKEVKSPRPEFRLQDLIERESVVCAVHAIEKVLLKVDFAITVREIDKLIRPASLNFVFQENILTNQQFFLKMDKRIDD